MARLELALEPAAFLFKFQLFELHVWKYVD